VCVFVYTLATEVPFFQKLEFYYRMPLDEGPIHFIYTCIFITIPFMPGIFALLTHSVSGVYLMQPNEFHGLFEVI